MKHDTYQEYKKLVESINEMNLTFFKIDDSYSNVKAMYEGACYLNKVNNRNLKEGVVDNIKSIQLLSDEKQELVWFSIESKEKRSVKWFFVLLASDQWLFLSYEDTKKLLSKYI